MSQGEIAGDEGSKRVDDGRRQPVAVASFNWSVVHFDLERDGRRHTLHSCSLRLKGSQTPKALTLVLLLDCWQAVSACGQNNRDVWLNCVIITIYYRHLPLARLRRVQQLYYPVADLMMALHAPYHRVVCAEAEHQTTKPQHKRSHHHRVGTRSTNHRHKHKCIRNTHGA